MRLEYIICGLTAAAGGVALLIGLTASDGNFSLLGMAFILTGLIFAVMIWRFDRPGRKG